MVLISFWTGNASNNAGRLNRLEWKIDLILGHLGIDPNQSLREKVMQIAQAGNKIQAIKFYREQTGAGLKEAKDYVERCTGSARP